MKFFQAIMILNFKIAACIGILCKDSNCNNKYNCSVTVL